MGIAIEKSIKNIRENGTREQKENKRSRATEWRFRDKSVPLYCDAVAQIIDDRRKLETPFVIIGAQFANQICIRFHSHYNSDPRRLTNPSERRMKERSVLYP